MFISHIPGYLNALHLWRRGVVVSRGAAHVERRDESGDDERDPVPTLVLDFQRK